MDFYVGLLEKRNDCGCCQETPVDAGVALFHVVQNGAAPYCDRCAKEKAPRVFDEVLQPVRRGKMIEDIRDWLLPRTSPLH